MHFLYTINVYFQTEFPPQNMSRAGKGTIMEMLATERYGTCPVIQFIMSL